jgi:uncharacterized protein (TIGR02271 family)
VPTRCEEVTIEHVPGQGEVTEAELGEDEVSVSVTEEVVVEKRPVAKEEVRIRKDVVEDTEIVEEDVRREEVEIGDESTGCTR